VYQFLIKIQWKQTILKPFRFPTYAAFVLSLIKITEDKQVASQSLWLMLDLKYSSQKSTITNWLWSNLYILCENTQINLITFLPCFITFALRNLKMISLFTWVDVMRYSFFDVGAGCGLLTPRSVHVNWGIAPHPLYWRFGGAPQPKWAVAEILAPPPQLDSIPLPSIT